jgi:hypothetical protein
LSRAWSEGRLAHLWHKQEETGRIFEYDFAPYFIEPYAIGQTTHVIGLRKSPDKMLTFKLERIQRAELLTESYTIPPDFNPQAQLADAWGIWYTDAEPVEVVLKFHPRVAGRVKETRWHRSEDVTEQPDGYLLWRARIAEPQEMLPWVRGWVGSRCRDRRTGSLTGDHERRGPPAGRNLWLGNAPGRAGGDRRSLAGPNF